MSGPRYSVEYTGWGSGTDGDGGRPEPAFIRQFKQRAGCRPEATLADKFAAGADKAASGKADKRAEERLEARTEEEMPQIVVTPDSGVTPAELAAVQAHIREAGEEARFEESRSRVRYVRPGAASAAGGGGSGSGGAKRKSSELTASASSSTADKRLKPAGGAAATSVCDRKLLSFDDEEGDD